MSGQRNRTETVQDPDPQQLRHQDTITLTLLAIGTVLVLAT